MGNSNSSNHRSSHGQGHQHRHSQWSHSLETPEQRNRMKRGYYPPRPYIAHPGLPQPQKVLPQPVNPNKLLKATSNGAILHGGGTISGRKLAELELIDPRKRSTVSCPIDPGSEGHLSGRSTPNLNRMRMNGSSKGSSSREYDSEPDLRDVGMDHHQNGDSGDDSPQRSTSPLPNSFTLIEESPAKKQIRSRKKSKAPPPPGHPGYDPSLVSSPPYSPSNGHIPNGFNPNNGYNMAYHSNNGFSPRQAALIQQQQLQFSRHFEESQGKKKLNRLFKTKAESRSALNSPAIRSELSPDSGLRPDVARGSPMRASLDANKIIRGDKDRVSQHSQPPLHNPQPSRQQHSQSPQPIPDQSRSSFASKMCSSAKPKSSSSSSQPIDRESEAGVGSNPRMNSSSQGPLAEVVVKSAKPNRNKDEPEQGKHARKQLGDDDPSSRDASGLPKIQLPKTKQTSQQDHQLNKISNKISTGLAETPIIINSRNGLVSPSAANKSNSSNSKHNNPLEPLRGSNATNTGANNGPRNVSNTSQELQQDREKKTFYFGMGMGTLTSAAKQTSVNIINKNKEKQGKHGSASPEDFQGEFSNNGNLHKEISRRKMLKQMEEMNNEEKEGRNGNTNEIIKMRSHSRTESDDFFDDGPNDYDNAKEKIMNLNKMRNNNNNNNIGSNQVNMKSNGIGSNGKVVLGKTVSNNTNNRSESDSDGLHRRQDSGNFEINENRVSKGSKGLSSPGVIRESSSDLSSSDLDVSLVVRPTLPQKRPDLPRFSPSAAWRALDSPSRISISGRSYSSEEGGLNGDPGRIHGYTRPAAPPRVSHERSGDSGISAGDAGSPANPLPCDPIDLSPSPVIGWNNPRNASKSKKNLASGSGNINNIKDSADRMIKCWTPEQDLDESSSDFEQETMLPPPPAPPKPTNNNAAAARNRNAGPKFTPTGRNSLFEGKLAAAVVSDSDSKYYGGGGEAEQGRPSSRYYHGGRSARSKVAVDGYTSSNSGISGQRKRFVNAHAQGMISRAGPGSNTSRNLIFNKYPNTSNHPSNNNNRRGDNLNYYNYKADARARANGFVGLDTNWFLSRSEPNSLHCIGISGDDGQELHNPLRPIAINNRERDAQLLAKVFPHQNKRTAHNNNKINSSNGNSRIASGNAQQNKTGRNVLGKGTNSATNSNSNGVSGREVIIGSRRRMNDQDDEFECELELEDEESSDYCNTDATTANHYEKERSGVNGGKNFANGSSSNVRNANANNVKKANAKKAISNNTTTTKTKIRNQSSSEIGYGPSSMNFYSPTTSYQKQCRDEDDEDYAKDEDLAQDTETRRSAQRNGAEDDEDNDDDELMRDDLFDYLDQYEEGEFEREQEMTTGNNNHGGRNRELMDRQNLSNEQKLSQRPFSHHIMYLPSYDSRRVQNSAGWRRARSVDHLDSEVSLFRRGHGGNHYFSGEEQDRSSRSRDDYNNGRRVVEDREFRNSNQNRKHSEPNFPLKSSSKDLRTMSPPAESKPKPMQKSLSPSPKPVQGSRTPSAQELADEIAEAERRAANKKKFKFQSTLRVQERRKIEKELTREAQQREEERLQEIEAMKKVEEEFQKKRAKEKLEAQAKNALANLNGSRTQSPDSNELRNKNVPKIVETRATSGSNSTSNSRGSTARPSSNGGVSIQPRNALSHQPSTTSSGGSDLILNRAVFGNKTRTNFLSSNKRQEPEGAPASVSVSSVCNSNAAPNDLRKELISASKKRNGNVMLGGVPPTQELTQELSEFRQETRQYCDYRSRGPRQQSLSPARFTQHSSSSDIFPISSRRKGGGGGSNYSGGSKASGRSTIHPEVVCDIPSKPHPYMVNVSRLSGSALNLVSEERPGSGLGSVNNLSSPSSVISDNYRREWAHHQNPSKSGIQQGGRASSVISLHSAPGYSYSSSADNFRNSTSDLSRFNHHLLGHSELPSHRRKGASRTLSTSPQSASPLPPRGISSSDSTATESTHPGDDSRRVSPVRVTSRSHTTVISIGAAAPYMPQMRSAKSPRSSEGIFQAQPYNKVKGYRPVAFKPNSVVSSTAAVS